ncbi:MAG TPA: hypothetical protein VJ692_00310 [Nitrospiraceae bacterium]|nr:hypothetical protein [Nitrospiraceae bacterium]
MTMTTPSDNLTPALPTREELQAELVPVPDLPPPPEPLDPPGTEDILAQAVKYVRGRRGADLLAVILVGSASRRALTTHSDLNLIVLVKGQDEGEEIVRVSSRLIDIRYRNQKAVEQEMPQALRLAPLLRKGRVLFDHEALGAKLVEKAGQRFRQGPPPAGMNEKIHLKADCLHRLGKAEDLSYQPSTSHYLLNLFFDDLLQAFFRLKGYWLTAPTDLLRFVSTRDAAVGDLLERAMTTSTLAERLALSRQLANLIFKDIPNPPRVD